MFTWICPKCGKEVPPAYSECPNCAAVGREPAPSENPAATVARPEEPPPMTAPPPAAPAEPQPVAPAPAPARRSGHVSIPGWMLSLLVAAVLIIIGLTVVVVKDSGRAAPSQPAAAVLETPAGSPTASQTNPVFRNVELTGLRLTEDAKQKPFVQVVVVNHSGADLGDLNAKVNLKAGAKKDQEPVGTFTLKTSLGPYESKDVKAPLETKLRVYELPDWQFLRAEVLP